MSPQESTPATAAPQQAEIDRLRAAVARVEAGETAQSGEAAQADDAGQLVESGESDAGAARTGVRGPGAPSRPVPPPAPEVDEEADPYAVARAVVLRLLAGSPKSRAELERALRRKGCADDVAAEVLDRMEHVGLVDDTAFAETFVRSKQATRGLAGRALAHELRAKGVDEETARGVLDEIDPHSERETARALVEKRLGRMHGLDRDVQTRRLAGMLARKGYGGEVAHGVIRECLDALPEHRRD